MHMIRYTLFTIALSLLCCIAITMFRNKISPWLLTILIQGAITNIIIYVAAYNLSTTRTNRKTP